MPAAPAAIEHPDALIGALLARCRFPAGATDLDCAVSGGADSLALLVLAAASGCRVTAWHVDHGLRADSALEADVVAAVATRLGADFTSLAVSLDPGPNLEARARAARYRALPAEVLTGHTADDQVETVLLALSRGAGLDGLAGMGPERHPMLGLRRSETEALCAALSIVAVVDPSNLDPAHRRNRMRHELLPLWNEIADRDLVPIIARQCGILADEAALLDELAAAVDPTDAAAIANAPVAVARRVIRHWLTRDHPPDSRAVERVLAVARGEIRATELSGFRVARRSGRLRVEST